MFGARCGLGWAQPCRLAPTSEFRCMRCMLRHRARSRSSRHDEASPEVSASANETLTLSGRVTWLTCKVRLAELLTVLLLSSKRNGFYLFQ